MNSDVPGGFAESSLLPDLARKITDIPELDYNSFGDRMVDAISYAIYNARTMKIDNQEFTIYYSLANFYKG